MAEDVRSSKSSNEVTIALAFVLLALGVYGALYWFQDKTELFPSHDASLNACLWAGGISGIMSLIVWSIATKRYSLWRRSLISFAMSLEAALIVFILSSSFVDIVNQSRDFPAAGTKTSPALIEISRAYHTHGKGASAHIQTQPLWSDMTISDGDYQFMLAHRPPDDSSHNSDEIKSNGYFCAKVTVQESDKAIRVLHAGRHVLPAGTVILCPVDPADQLAP